ncbi:hypothetical protein FGO68_gene4669 [Halteria grandinella]|uniref:Uncharacterized protein n=1 Tax=Halteria grandinella TaxID=5974 RepID=A0A8J8P681_HALGN|nr:hypothetical protein FGO68_gene4669 [Halteria grandinella]
MFTLVFNVTGALVAGYEHLTTEWFSYGLVFMNNLTTSIYTVVANRVNKNKRIGAFEINYFFALCGFLVTLGLVLNSDAIDELISLTKIEDQVYQMQFIGSLVLSGVLGIFITCSSLMVLTMASPVALTITGKKNNRDNYYQAI